MTKLAATEVAAPDPDKFMATIGKRSHPPGRPGVHGGAARPRPYQRHRPSPTTVW